MSRLPSLLLLACSALHTCSADGGTGDFACPPGFEVELVYSVPLDAQGSWVRMTSDDRGRLITSDEFGGLYRVTPGTTPDETLVEAIDQPIGEAQGLLFAHDALYVVVSRSDKHPSGLYRLDYLRDADRFGPPQLLRELGGRGERGPHGIALGPDGMLYLVAGYHTPYQTLEGPMAPFIDKASKTLFPALVDRVEPHPPGGPACGGWVARTDPDGHMWELFCSGMQNPYDIAFNDAGEVFTYDSDMEWDLGTSWYRPTRVLHLCSGGDYGWRPGSAKYPSHFIDSLPPAVEIGRGSPTGLTFGHAAAFPERYRRALFVGDWTHGRIYAVHLEPRGASYTGHFEVFVARKPLPVADVKVHSDGSLYFLVGGRKTDSALYRVTCTDTAATAAAPASENADSIDARAVRVKLEALHHRNANAAGLDFAWKQLRHRDRHVRYAARIAIEHQDPQLWERRVFTDPSTPATLEAVTALVHGATPRPPDGLIDRVLNRLNQVPLDQLEPGQARNLVRVYALALMHLGVPAQPQSLQVLRNRLAQIESMDAGDDEAEVLELQARLGDTAGVARGIDRLCSAGTQELQVQFAATLRHVVLMLPRDRQRTYLTWLNVAEEQYAGGDRFRTFIQMMRDDAVRRLPDAVRREYADLIDQRIIPANTIRRTTKQFVHNWQYEFLAAKLADADHGRSFEDGSRAFVDAGCATCHRFQGSGGDVGPDLSLVGQRYDREYILESILLPDKVVNDRYERSVVLTKDGASYEGRIVGRSAEFVDIKTNRHATRAVRVPADAVDTIVPAGRSEMPSGLLNVLTQAEILDLIAFLVSEGNKDDPCFSR